MKKLSNIVNLYVNQPNAVQYTDIECANIRGAVVFITSPQCFLRLGREQILSNYNKGIYIGVC